MAIKELYPLDVYRDETHSFVFQIEDENDYPGLYYVQHASGGGRHIVGCDCGASNCTGYKVSARWSPGLSLEQAQQNVLDWLNGEDE